MRLEMWPQWGGVIGDKVTLMFRLFNTHLFTHTPFYARHLKASFSSWEKVMSPEKGHNGPVWAFQMCCRGCSCQRHAVSQLSSLFMRSSTFSSGFASDDASPLFFQAIAKRALSSFFCGRTWASRCPKPAHLHLFALFCKPAHILISSFAHSREPTPLLLI